MPQRRGTTPVPPEIVCVADVPAEEWERYEILAAEQGEPPDTLVDPKERV